MPTTPYKIVARNATKSTRDIVMSEFQRAAKMVTSLEKSPSFYDDLVAPRDISVCGAYLVLNVTAQYDHEFPLWAGYVESRIVDLVIQLENLLKEWNPRPAIRPCPTRLRGAAHPLRAYFLIGIDVPSEKCSELAQLVANRVNFDAFSRWPQLTAGTQINIDVRADITDVLADANAYVEETLALADVGAFQPVAAEEERVLNIIEPAEPHAPGKYNTKYCWIFLIELLVDAVNNYAEASKKNEKDKKDKKKKGQQKDPEDFSEKKLRMRTSIEVFNRIKWDNSLPKEDFIIGYDDRFLGIMEVPFDEFDLETIPLHRIRIFKRSGVVVWSRNDRIDAVFKYGSKK